ncbi:MAG: phosphatase [Fibrobacter sp.]|nr:phosphatase [Fibrobacter sp.]
MFSLRPASIDIGSHSVLLNIAAWDEVNGLARLVPKVQKSQILRLGGELHQNNAISELLLEEVRKALLGYRQDIYALGANLQKVVLTQAARMAENYQELLDLVESVLQTKAEILSGEEEALYTWRGVQNWHGQDLVSIDIGGGSTEFCDGINYLSVPIGALQMRQEMGEIPGLEYKKWSQKIFKTIDLKPFRKKEVFFVGGSAVALAMLQQNMSQHNWQELEGLTLEPEDLTRNIQRITDVSKELRPHLPGLADGRSEVIICGLYWMRSIVERLRLKQFKISTLGLRYGVLLDGKNAIK